MTFKIPKGHPTKKENKCLLKNGWMCKVEYVSLLFHTLHAYDKRCPEVNL